MIKTITNRQLRPATLLLSLLFSVGAMQAEAQTVVSGKINSEDNVGLPGVTITIKGTSQGVISDADGNYSISVDPNSVLIFSFVGLTTQEVPIQGRTTIDVVLIEDIKTLSEIIVVGYGTQKKSHLTGAISKVEGEKLSQIAVARVDDALVGQVSGVNIQATDGTVGSAPTIRIRGTGSITSSAGPLLVIDGVAVSSDFFGSLDMNDIESFEVLKDASSAAIFGSRGANGVIMITTKRGKEGKTKFSYDTYIGVQDVKNNPDYNMSLAESLQAELAANGELSARSRYKQLIGVDNNWQDIIFDGGTIQSHAISARGGNKATQFSTTFSYLHDEGVLLTDDFKRYNFKASVNTKVSDKFSFGLSLNPSFTDTRRFDGSTHDILRQEPWLPVYHDENTIQFVDRAIYPNVVIGDYALQRHFDNYDLDGDGVLVDISSTSNTNPAAKVLESDRRNRKFKLLGSIEGKYEFNENFNINTLFSGNYQDSENSRYQGIEQHEAGAGRASSELGGYNQINLVGQIFLAYKKNIGNHEISATAGTAIEKRHERFSNILGTGYTFDFVETINAATIISEGTSFEREKSLLSFIGRATYAFKDKYLASVSIRRDGSSVFGEDRKYGNFPAMSAGWRISEENFLNNSNIVSNLKIRASYGVTGNDEINTSDPLVDWYAYTSLLEARSAAINGTATAAFNPSNIENPVLQWERSIEFSQGVDFGFLGDRITGSLDHYNRKSDELLLDIEISAVTGFRNALVNIGEVTNKGFEFELRTRNTTGKLKWSTTFIGSRNENELTDFADANGAITNVDDKRAAEWINLVGNPISSFYGYVVDRDIPTEYLKEPFHPVGGQAQDVYVRDLNGDGLIDDDDKTILGNPYPKFVWSITNNFEFKGFELSFMFQGSMGAQVRNMVDQYMYNHFNSSQDIDPLTTPDQGFIQQKIFTSDIIQDASYLALRTASVGYNFPKKMLQHVKMSKARVYVSGQNLLYWKSSDFTGWNPEAVATTSPTTYGYSLGGGPIARKVVIGVNINF